VIDRGTTDNTIDCGFFPPCQLQVSKTCLVIPPPGGNDCQGKVQEMKFEYTGEACAEPLANDQSGKATCSGDPGGMEPVQIINQEGSSAPGDESLFVGDIVTLTPGGSTFPSQTDIDVVEGGQTLQSVSIHTSCSKPLSVGDVFGSLRLVELTTTEGGTVGLPDPTPSEVCEALSDEGRLCTQRPRSLRLRLTGGDCSASSNTQDAGKVICTDGSAPSGDVFSVLAYKDGDPSAVYLDQDGLSLGELVDILPAAVGRNDLDSSLTFEVWEDGTLIQRITFHTSCSQDLRIGDVYGFFEVWGFSNPSQGTLAAGAEIQYFYEVSNIGETVASSITVIDDNGTTDTSDDFAVEGSPIDALDPGNSVTLSAFRSISEDTINTVTVQGDIAGNFCSATDTATVDIEPRPASCDDGKPRALLFEYTGEGCSASDNDQGDKATCSGDPAGSGPVKVVYTGGKSEHFVVTPSGELIEVFDSVLIERTDGNRFEANTKLEIRQGDDVLQELEIHTSCSQPLNVGDQFGSLILRQFFPL
jgi:hypothetical protein